MKSTFSASQYIRIAITCTLLAILSLCGLSSCHRCSKPIAPDMTAPVSVAATTNNPANTLTDIVGIINIQKSEDSRTAMVSCSRHEMIFTVFGADQIARLESAMQQQTPIRIVFDPSKSILLRAEPATQDERNHFSARLLQAGTPSINLEAIQGNEEAINHVAEMGVINTSESGLTPVVPDMATAQQMFNYFASQCCQNPGPFNIDHCITFQYCADGCYARAHKMCYLLNNKYHYATKKVFSFATGSYSLSVKAEKWCDQCITWWYHVAPLVTIQTTTGPKAFVFDPAMFDEPVLLATWLHAQENPGCSSAPKVTTINIQPTSSYSPVTFGVTNMFDTDPLYSDTNSTLISYRTLHTCP